MKLYNFAKLIIHLLIILSLVWFFLSMGEIAVKNLDYNPVYNKFNLFEMILQ